MTHTRCKLRLDSITITTGSKSTPSGYVPCEVHTIEMSPVYGNGNPEHENTKFWQASPSGSFKLGCVNVDAVAHMKVGKEYYIDITPAETA